MKEKTIVFVGSCITQFYRHAMNEAAKHTPELLHGLRQEYGLSSWQCYLTPYHEKDVFGRSGDSVLYRFPVRKMTRYHLDRIGYPRNPVHPYMIPSAKDERRDWIYCWGGLMCPIVLTPKVAGWYHGDITMPNSAYNMYKWLIDAVSAKNAAPSQGFITDCLAYMHQAQINFLRECKELDLNILVIEPNLPIAPIDIDQNAYRRVILEDRRQVKARLKDLGIPVVALPESLIDESGFTPTCFNNPDYENDCIHPSPKFYTIMLKEVFNFINQNYAYTGTNDRLRLITDKPSQGDSFMSKDASERTALMAQPMLQQQIDIVTAENKFLKDKLKKQKKEYPRKMRKKIARLEKDLHRLRTEQGRSFPNTPQKRLIKMYSVFMKRFLPSQFVSMNDDPECFFSKTEHPAHAAFARVLNLLGPAPYKK